VYSFRSSRCRRTYRSRRRTCVVGHTRQLPFTEKYLLIFEEDLKKAKEPDGLIKAMKETFPSSDFLLAIERGAQANVKH
jgi:hypothetical protein